MKFKKPTKEFIKISLDRLTRFKPVSEKYKRVFDDILNKHLIFEGIKLSDIEEDEKIKLAVEIFNSSFDSPSNYKINEILKKDEEEIFNLTKEDKIYLDSKIDFEKGLELFSLEELPLNLKRLKLQKDNESKHVRENFSTLYPISKVVLVEGITEEILLIEFAKILGLDFKKKGIFVLGAGGKNQVARKYYKLIEEIKIPIFILLDSDAGEIQNIIKPKLRKIDEIYMINSGEFEDILPKNLIKNALNYHFQENLPADSGNFEEEGHAVYDLNCCYKNNGWGDFKKADFAKIIREYLLQTENPPVSEELKLITEKIKSI
ncbi:MAG: ATP-dependent endonuclease [bacterium]|nr:ATP-dependent endonuclease [bacterium]